MKISLAEMFECLTWCAVMAAFSDTLGGASIGLLIAMCVAVSLRQGIAVLATFAGATLAADRSTGASPATAALLVIFLAVALVSWHWMRAEYLASRRREVLAAHRRD